MCTRDQIKYVTIYLCLVVTQHQNTEPLIQLKPSVKVVVRYHVDNRLL